MISTLVKFLISPFIWLAYAVALRYLLWPYLEGWAGGQESISWAKAGLVLLMLFLATFLTLLTLALSPKKQDELDEPRVYRSDDIEPPSSEPETTIDVVAKRPNVEKM